GAYIEMGNLTQEFDMRPAGIHWPWWQYPPDGRENTGPIGTELNGVQAKIFQCSADTRSNLISLNPQKAALSGYMAVNGLNQFAEAGGQNGLMYVNSAVKITDIIDGTSNTLMVGERPPSQDLYYGWMWAGSGDSPYFGATDVVLGVREVTNGAPNGPRDFFRLGSLNDPQNIHRYHFWSLHPGGGQFLFVDGGVRFITYVA